MSEKVQVIILSTAENILEVLLLQTNTKRGLFWQNITGGAEDSDPDISHTAKREILEETGLNIPQNQIQSLNYSFSYHDKNRNIRYQEHLFVVVLKAKIKLSISAEHNDYLWKTASKVTSADYGFKSNFDGFLLSLQHVNKRS